MYIYIMFLSAPSSTEGHGRPPGDHGRPQRPVPGHRFWPVTRSNPLTTPPWPLNLRLFEELFAELGHNVSPTTICFENNNYYEYMWKLNNAMDAFWDFGDTGVSKSKTAYLFAAYNLHEVTICMRSEGAPECSMTTKLRFYILVQFVD